MILSARATVKFLLWAIMILGCLSQPSTYAQTTVNYQYDALGRLVTVEDATNGNRGYVYDAAGNRTSLNVMPPTAPPVSAPTISPNGGTFTSAQSVTLANATTGSTIYYTTNGAVPTTSSTRYTGPFTVSASATVKALAVKSGMPNSAVTTSSPFVITTQVSAPTISPNGGTFTSAQSVTLASATSGSTIYYTTNGAVPTTSSTVYSGPFAVSASATVKALAVKSGMTNSAVTTSAPFVITTQVSAPTISPNGGTFTSATSVSLASATAGASIYYTTNGSTPTTSSTLYSAPFTVSDSATVKALAVKPGMTNSAVTTSAPFVITSQVSTPTISPNGGTFTSAQSVTLASATSGATIYYTTDGSTPTTSSPVYSAIFTVNQTSTVKAIAAKAGMTTSGVASQTYTILDTQKPTKPGIPVFANITSSSADVSWAVSTDNVAVTGYEYSTTSSSGPWTSTGPSVRLSALSPSAPYWVYVRARDAAGNYSDVNSASFSTTNYKVANPSISPGSTNFSTSLWVSLSPVTTDSIVYFTTNGSTPTTSSEVFTSNIWVTRTMTVKAIAAKFGMETSDVVSATYTFVDDQKPSAPGTPSFSTTTSSSTNVSWFYATDNAGIASYEYSVYAGATLVASQNVGASLSATLTGLSPSTNYTVYVKARDFAGNVGDPSSAGFLTLTPPDTQAPTVPAISAPTAVSTTSFNISWAASSDNQGVAGYRYSINGSSWQTTATTNASFSGLTAGAYIPFQVKAYDAAGNESSPASYQVILTVAPPGALDLRSRASTTGDIYWVASPSANLAGYEYRVNGGSWVAASSSPVFLTGLTASTTYAVDVRAKNTLGNYSTLSSGSLGTIMATLPAPTGLNSYLLGDCAWRATWNSVPGAAYYIVKDTNSEVQNVTTTSADIYCPMGNSSGNKPKSVKACDATFCGNESIFTN